MNEINGLNLEEFKTKNIIKDSEEITLQIKFDIKTIKLNEDIDVRFKEGYIYHETENGVLGEVNIGFKKEFENVPYTRWRVNPGTVALGTEGVHIYNIRGGIGSCGYEESSPNCKLSASDRIYGKMVHGDIEVFVWYGAVPVLKVNNIVINDPVDNNKLTEEKEYAYLEGTRANVTRIRDEYLPEDLKYTYNEVKLNDEVISTDEDVTKERQAVTFQK